MNEPRLDRATYGTFLTTSRDLIRFLFANTKVIFGGDIDTVVNPGKSRKQIYSISLTPTMTYLIGEYYRTVAKRALPTCLKDAYERYTRLVEGGADQ